jgi:hypothetical protein
MLLIYPGAPLNCNNGQDNDCSGNIETWAYTDQDGDRYAPNNVSSCIDVVSFPGKITAGQELGYNDCNDTNSSIYPGAPLNCNNGQDNDCSGNVEKWVYTDVDGDRYAPNSTSSCVDVVSFPGQITVGQEFGTNDCNDNNASIYPGAPLNCSNGQDNDCSGNIETWAYTDQDGDLYAPNNVSSCVDVVNFPGKITAGQELGYNASINPNTIWFKDADLDGFYPAGGSSVSCNNPFAPNNATYVAIPGGDCNDTNSSIYPGAPLNCNNGQDNDCSGNIETWAYTDQDGDRYAPNSTSSCVDVDADSDNSILPEEAKPPVIIRSLKNATYVELYPVAIATTTTQRLILVQVRFAMELMITATNKQMRDLLHAKFRLVQLPSPLYLSSNHQREI